MSKTCLVIFDAKARSAFEDHVSALAENDEFVVISSRRFARDFARRHPGLANPYERHPASDRNLESSWEAFLADPVRCLSACSRAVVFRRETARSKEIAFREQSVTGLALALGLPAEIAIPGEDGLLILPAPEPQAAEVLEAIERWKRSHRRWNAAVREGKFFGMMTSGYAPDKEFCCWKDVERALNRLIGSDQAAGGQDRFCIVERLDENTYVQAAFQSEGQTPSWRIEWRKTFRNGAFRHFYGVERTRRSREAQMAYSLSTVKKVFREFLQTGGNTMSSDDVEWHELRVNPPRSHDRGFLR